MLTTPHFFVKACFHKSFISYDLHTLTEGALEAIFKSKGIITYFFDNEERRRKKNSVTVSLKS